MSTDLNNQTSVVLDTHTHTHLSVSECEEQTFTRGNNINEGHELSCGQTGDKHWSG